MEFLLTKYEQNDDIYYDRIEYWLWQMEEASHKTLDNVFFIVCNGRNR